jgi:hypothetical protein
MPWILGEEEGIKQIKAAYDAGVQTFDTADVSYLDRISHSNSGAHLSLPGVLQWYVRGDPWKGYSAT